MTVIVNKISTVPSAWSIFLNFVHKICMRKCKYQFQKTFNICSKCIGWRNQLSLNVMLLASWISSPKGLFSRHQPPPSNLHHSTSHRHNNWENLQSVGSNLSDALCWSFTLQWKHLRKCFVLKRQVTALHRAFHLKLVYFEN